MPSDNTSAATWFETCVLRLTIAVVPLVGVVYSLWLISFLQPMTWLRFTIWFVIGVIFCLTYGRRHSLLADRPVEPDAGASSERTPAG